MLSHLTQQLTGSLGASLRLIDRLCGITPNTTRGQNVYMACMLLVPLIPIIALVVQNVTQLNSTITMREELLEVEASVRASNDMAILVSKLQTERSGAVLMMLTNLDDVNIEDIKQLGLDLKKRFDITDTALDQVRVWRAPKGVEMFNSKLRFRIRLEDFRKKVIPDNETLSIDIRMEDVINFYNLATAILLDELSSLIKSSNGSSTWRSLVMYKNLLRAVDTIGTEMSLGLRFFGRGNLSRRNFVSLIEQHKLSREYMAQAETFATCTTCRNLRKDLDKVRYSGDFQAYNNTFNQLSKAANITFDTRGELIIRLFDYYRKTVNLMKSIRLLMSDFRQKVQVKLRLICWLTFIQETIRDEVWAVDREFVFSIIILSSVLLLSPLIVILIKNAIKALQFLSIAFLKKLNSHKKEKKRAEKLIHQMLPKSVADDLKAAKQTSKVFDATILFSEIDDFENLIKSQEPVETFAILDVVSKLFERRLAKYDVILVSIFFYLQSLSWKF